MVGIMAEEEFTKVNNHVSIDDDEYDSDEEFIDDSQFEDPDDFVDSITDDELVPDILAKCPTESDSLDTIIIVDNVPIVGPDRLEKLKKVIRKLFSNFGNIVDEYYPEENGKTQGYIFLEFSYASDAMNAIKTANGYDFDRSHTFIVNSFADFDKYSKVSEDWVAPETRPFNDLGNLWSWLLEPDSNDQYCMIHANGDIVEIHQNGVDAPKLIQKRNKWTNTYVVWSPQGTYLSTFHQPGIVLWGGEEFSRLHRFNHADVQLIDFSPCERYVVTCSQRQDKNSSDPATIMIWDIKTGVNKRGFSGGGQWPLFKWSPDGAFVARLAADDCLSVYESPTFGLLDKKSIKISGLKDFSWSPSQNLIAYWVPEVKDSPARVGIMELPSRKEIRGKNLFNVSDCQMYWQKNGDYLCVKVERYTKSKKGVYYNLELFKMKEKNIPIDTLELKDHITAFEWEPNGGKFCVIHGESPRIAASFYQLEERQLGKVTLMKSFDKKTCNTISWAPTGQFCVLAGLRSMNGVLEFIDTAEMTTMNTGEHYMATDVQWDPTGRFFVTLVSSWSHKGDNGYYVWSFQGKRLQRHALNQCCQFLWRPRPPTLLTQEDKDKVKKDLKKYQKKFENKDRQSKTKASKELIEKRRSHFEEFAALREKHRVVFEEYKPIRIQLRDGLDTDSLESAYDDIDEETVEFFIREEVEVIETNEQEN